MYRGGEGVINLVEAGQSSSDCETCDWFEGANQKLSYLNFGTKWILWAIRSSFFFFPVGIVFSSARFLTFVIKKALIDNKCGKSLLFTK